MNGRPTIAIVGIGGRFPDADDPDALWEHVTGARSAFREPPPGRWCLSPDEVAATVAGPDRVLSRRACFIKDFEPDLGDMDIDPALVRELDPMYGLLLHAANQAVQDCRGGLSDRQRTGIILGNIALPTEYVSRLTAELMADIIRRDLPAHPSTTRRTHPLNRYVTGLPAGLLARALGTGGNSYTLDAACASSLYALKYAVDELQARRADAMICGGLSRPDSLYTQMGFTTLGAVSPSGRCAPFDAGADGLVVGEGCGVLVLKRLEDALSDGDHIHATIAAAGISNDIRGNLMLPDSEGQLRAMQMAYRQAGWSPECIDLIECHGTGTPTGDRVEFETMRALWREQTSPGRRCVIGSVKSNIGHLLTAAGAAGLIKVLLAMRHRTLPPSANFRQAATGIDLDASPFDILTRAEEWKQPEAAHGRRAAVSAFGFGGINAHVLLEEYTQERPVSITPYVAPVAPDEPVAIIGMATHFGPWQDLEAFRQRTLGDTDRTAPTPADNRWGLAGPSAIPGYTLNDIAIPADRFRIPPRELRDMLGQQLLMLDVAARALDDAGLGEVDAAGRPDAGVYIGIGLDLNTTGFRLRWEMKKTADRMAESTGIDVERLLAALRDPVSPPLTADRTMGALGGIVASRIARAFHLGGAGFTLSSEESSGLHALEAAVGALRRGELNLAIAGAVDLGGDARSVAATAALKPWSVDGQCAPFTDVADGSVIGEGAAALVLKRHSDALRDGDRIYAIIEGIAGATGGTTQDLVPDSETLQRAMHSACDVSGVGANDISLIESHGSGIPDEDRIEARAIAALIGDNDHPVHLGSTMAAIGHSGAASGLASLARAALALHHRRLQPLRRRPEPVQGWPDTLFPATAPMYWLHDRQRGPRRALVTSLSIAGNALAAIIREKEDPALTPALPVIAEDRLFSIEADDQESLLLAMTALKQAAAGTGCIATLARDHYLATRQQPPSRLALSLLAGSSQQLAALLDEAMPAVREQRELHTERLFYTPAPLGTEAGVTLVFPGSGNHYPGMGRDIALRWPEAVARQERENERHAAQFAQARFWSTDDPSGWTHEEVIFGQVWLGTLVSDVLAGFGVRPDAILGYSLGETAGLFATRAWTDRDLMLTRMQSSNLFKTELAGPCTTARERWGLSSYVDVDWTVGVVNCPAAAVRERISRLPWVYLLIINTPDECVIGGNRIAVEGLVRELGCHFHAVETITTVHCELAAPVREAYRALHVYDTQPAESVRYYSCHFGGRYVPDRDSAADSITGMALETFDYTRVVNAAWEDGARLFIEVGPGSSCTRMIDRILGDRPHAARAIAVRGRSGVNGVLQTLALLNTHRVALDLEKLYPAPATPGLPRQLLRVPLGHSPLAFELPSATPTQISAPTPASVVQLPRTTAVKESRPVTAAVTKDSRPAALATGTDPMLAQMIATESARALTHDTFLRVANGISLTLSRAISMELALLDGTPGPLPDLPAAPVNATPDTPQPFMNREQCLAYAIGSIGAVLGERYAIIDSYPTRVRLPDEPLMLVDRILEVEGEACSMSSGRVVTEHDIHPDAWYLDGGRIPVCIAVEAGQADLFLSGWLGIDHQTRGLAVYRLLDAEITFHGPLPRPGQVIHYDIHIDHFFNQGDTRLFRFRFDGSVDGRPLLTMRHGCAGFFSQAELDAGKGIVLTSLQLREEPGARSADWVELLPLEKAQYDDAQIAALRAGNLAGCFGPAFAALPLQRPAGLPGDRMTLVHRVLELDPDGGRFGLGRITGEADIHPDDWFLTCHFVDDQVMPGTLMYECCLHTLRIFLLRLGWVGERDQVVYEPVPGVTGKLKCRGQVIATTQKVQYEISIKALGYEADGTPYAIADALMSADHRPIVQMTDMSLRLSGLTRDRLIALWQSNATGQLALPARRVLFDSDSILAFATGKPSEAFGDRYRIFDHDRVIARLPGPPYKFLDRIVAIEGCEAWQLRAGGVIEAEYDIPPDEWYFEAERQPEMPFAVLLEIALQPCGWLAAYLGSALTSETDLSFRNLGGTATRYLPVGPDTGTLSIGVKITRVSSSGGMIIQNFDYEVRSAEGVVYRGDTYFGFFSKAALANQVGIREATLYQPGTQEIERAASCAYPLDAPYPDRRMRMVDTITHYDPAGGPQGLGFIRGTASVDPDAWFFRAHFHQDPVWPGSLGLESFIQLLKYHAMRRIGAEGSGIRFETPVCGEPHSWLYRGQILPTDREVNVEAIITGFDEATGTLRADGLLSVDGRIIYQMNGFTLRITPL